MLTQSIALNNALSVGVAVLEAIRHTPTFEIVSYIDDNLAGIDSQKGVSKQRKLIWATVEVYRALEKIAKLHELRVSLAALNAIELMDRMIDQHKERIYPDRARTASAREVFNDWKKTFEPKRHIRKSRVDFREKNDGI